MFGLGVVLRFQLQIGQTVLHAEQLRIIGVDDLLAVAQRHLQQFARTAIVANGEIDRGQVHVAACAGKDGFIAQQWILRGIGHGTASADALEVVRLAAV